METRVKDLSELPDLRSMKRESCGLPKNWSFGRGGQHLDSDQWAISFTHDDLSQDLYPLPIWVTVLIRWSEKNARENLQRDLRNLLDL